MKRGKEAVLQYLSPGAKVRGKVLTEFTAEKIRDIPVTRRLISRVLLFLSRSCELTTATQLDMDLRDKDKELGILFQDYLLHIIQEFYSVYPFNRCPIEAVFQIKSMCRDIINICPQATVFLNWLAGCDNHVDLNSKLHMHPFAAVNSDMYRHGPSMFLDMG